jgi:hypothetical protein
MVYLNLLYGRKVDTVASENEREQLMKTADDLVDRVKDIKQKRSERPANGSPSGEGVQAGSFLRTSVARRPRWSWMATVSPSRT